MGEVLKEAATYSLNWSAAVEESHVTQRAYSVRGNNSSKLHRQDTPGCYGHLCNTDSS
jgi:hypothetical protein